MKSLDIINMTKYINVNNKTSFIQVISRNYHQVCNAVYLDNLTDNEIFKTGRFQLPDLR